MKKQYGAFEKYPLTDREGKRLRIKSDADLARFLRSFLTLAETPVTPYRRKKPGRAPTYNRKAH